MKLRLTAAIGLFLCICAPALAEPFVPNDEPPIETKEQLVERFRSFSMDDLRQLPSSEQRTAWKNFRDRMGSIVEVHPEIVPLLPELRDHPDRSIRDLVFENELLVPDLRNDAVRQAIRSGNAARMGRAMKYVGPLLGEPEIAETWLTYVHKNVLEYGGLGDRLIVLEDAPENDSAKLKLDLAHRLLVDLRDDRVPIKMLPSVLTYLREQSGIDAEELLEAVIAAHDGLDDKLATEQNRYATPELLYRRATNSLFVTRVFLGDEDALDSILKNAKVSEAPERQHYIALLDEIPPTMPVMNTAFELLGDSEQVGEIPPMPHGSGSPTPILARDMAAFVVREWFRDAPGSRKRNMLRPVPEQEIGELKTWLALRMYDLSLPESDGSLE